MLTGNRRNYNILKEIKNELKQEQDTIKKEACRELECTFWNLRESSEDRAEEFSQKNRTQIKEIDSGRKKKKEKKNQKIDPGSHQTNKSSVREKREYRQKEIIKEIIQEYFPNQSTGVSRLKRHSKKPEEHTNASHCEISEY